MDKSYKVIFASLLKGRDYFKDRMSRLGVSKDVSEGLIKKAPVILKQGLSLKDARKYADAVFHAGGKVAIQVECSNKANQEKNTVSNIVPLKNFTMCPQCGYKQLKTGTCIKCGLKFNV